MLHPYYKLAYIKVQWGGPDEQAAEIEAENPHAKNRQDEAQKIVEKNVSCLFVCTFYLIFWLCKDGEVL